MQIPRDLSSKQLEDWSVGVKSAIAVCVFLVFNTAVIVGSWTMMQGKNTEQDRIIADLDAKVSNISTQINITLNERRVARDQQAAAVSGRIDGLEGRIRPLEVSTASTASSLAFIRDNVISGFAEIGRRLDRMEGNNRP